MPEDTPTIVPSFGEGTMDAFARLYHEDAKTVTSRWTTKYNLINKAFPTLNRGLVLLAANENGGKSNLAGEFYTGVLDETTDSMVLDFVLDDDREDRMRALVAARAKLSMTDVQIAGALEENGLKAQWRTWAYGDLMERYKDRLAIIDGECLQGKGGIIKNMADYIGQVRSENKDRPLWVNVDAFDDIDPGENMDENTSVSVIAKALKKVSKRHDCVVFATKQLIKGSGRAAGTDSMRGYGALKYHAKIVLMAYNEVAEEGEAAEIYHTREDRPGEKAPVFEVRVRKNKAGSFKGLICFRQFPEQYRSEEMPEHEQRSYRDAVFAEMSKAKKPRRD